MPQDRNERATLRQFCKVLTVFMVFWGVVVATAMTSFSPKPFS